MMDSTDLLDRRRLAGEIPPPHDDGPGVLRPVLICFSGSAQGQRWILSQNQLLIGRSSEADWMLPDSSSSRYHARILYENADQPHETPICWIEDLGSRNGTGLNGRAVTERSQLRERDRIQIGSTIIGYFLRDDEELRHDESLIASATRDHLTGLYNRRQLTRFLRYIISNTQRRHYEAYFLLLDMDHFKSVNDQFGHDIGDHVLRHVADLLRQQCRTSDLVARWGGEEFAICLPYTTRLEAKACCERLRESLLKYPFALEDGQALRLTLSIGGTELRPSDTPNTLFVRADRMLYRAKNHGRDRVVFSQLGEEDDGGTTSAEL